MTGGAAGAAVGLTAACGLLLVGAALLLPARPSTPRRGSLTRLVESSGVRGMSAGRLLAASVGCALVAAVVGLALTAVPIVGAVAAVAGAVLPALMLQRRAAQRRRQLAAAWPDAVDTLHSGVRAGLSLPEALAALGRSGPSVLCPAFTAFAVEHRATGSVESALRVLQEDLADPVADRVVAALRLTGDVGGRELGSLLRTLSVMLREEARTRAEIEARQSWTVAAARLAVAAPWITLLLLCTRPEAVAAYLAPAGAVVIATAAVLSAIAYVLMRRIGRLPRDERVVA